MKILGHGQKANLQEGNWEQTENTGMSLFSLQEEQEEWSKMFIWGDSKWKLNRLRLLEKEKLGGYYARCLWEWWLVWRRADREQLYTALHNRRTEWESVKVSSGRFKTQDIYFSPNVELNVEYIFCQDDKNVMG